MITDPTTIPNCFVWLDGSDTSTMFTGVSASRQNINPFSISFWRWSIMTSTSVSAERLVLPAPNGLSGANIISAISTSTGMRGISATCSTTLSNYTFSVFLRPYNFGFAQAAVSAVALDFINSNGTLGATCGFQLSGNGAVSATPIRYGGVVSPTTATITLTSNNWYLCSLTVGTSGNTPMVSRIRVLQDGIVGVYGAGVELSSTRVANSFLNRADVRPTANSVVTPVNRQVAFWRDKTNSNRDFSIWPNATTTAPLWNPTLSSIDFDGSDDRLLSYFNKKYDDGQTIFMVAERGAADDRYMFDQFMGQLYSSYSAMGVAFSPPLYSYRSFHTRGYGHNGSGTGIGSWQFAFPRTTTYMDRYNKYSTYCSWISGNRQGLVLDGMYQCVETGTYNGSTMSPAMERGQGSFYVAPIRYAPSVNTSTIGAGVDSNYNTVSFFLGKVFEFIIYDRGLTPQEIENVNYYLANKWKHLSLAKTVYAVKNGRWDDPTTWNINSEPLINSINQQDNVFTNQYQVTATNLSINVNTIGSHCATPSLSQGGTFLMSGTTNLTAQVLGIAAGSFYSSFTVTVSSGPNNLLNYFGPSLNHGRCLQLLPESKAFLRNSQVNYTESLVTTIGNPGFCLGSGSGTCILTTRSNTISGTNLTISGRHEQSNIANARIHGYAFELSGANNELFIANSSISSGRSGNVCSPSASIVCRKVPNVAVTNRCILSSCQITRNVYQLNSGGDYSYSVVNVPIVFSTGSLLVYNSSLFNTGFVNYNDCYSVVTLSGDADGYFENNFYVLPSPTAPGTNYYNRNITPAIHNIGSTLGNPTLTLRLSSGFEFIPSLWTPVIWSTSTAPVSVFTENSLLNSPHGRQAISARRLKLFLSGPNTQHIRQTTSKGDFVYLWKDSAIFNYPLSSDVVFNTTYGNNALTGTSVLPPASGIYFGVPVGPPENRYYGTATFDPNSLLSVPLTADLLFDSIGNRIRNATTNDTLTAMAQAFVKG
jgi:hypothetical protein